MSSRLADRLQAARRRRFVGRAPERTLFESALTAPELPFCVLYVYGPGGVGKTTLLKEFMQLAEATGARPFYIDARNVDPAPDLLITALQGAMGLVPPAAPLEQLAAAPGRQLILIDTYETLAPLDGWVREAFLPQLPDNTLVVLAGRRAPAAGWRTDPGWHGMFRILPLRNLSPDESRAYLSRREVPPAQHREVLRFTHGHPLALSLVADVFAQRGDFDFHPEAEPDVVKALLEELVQKVPSPAHRAALEMCALVRLTTEDLLADTLTPDDPHELFEWLRDLSFVDSGPLGLFPHDLAREALVADLRWRNPTWYAELHRRARVYFGAALQKNAAQEQQRVLFNYMFLHRDNPMVRPFMEWQESGSVLPGALEDGDRPALRAMVAQHEGPESAGLADHWFTRQPEGVVLFRDTAQHPVAFLARVALEDVTEDDLHIDPAVAAAWRYVQNHGALRPGERAELYRFWMAHDTYQDVSAAQSLLLITIVRHYLTAPKLVWTFLPFADPAFWAPLCAYADLARLPDADFTVGGRTYGVYGHDWRAVTPLAWLSLLGEREIAATVPTLAPPRTLAPLVVLSEQAFAAAVRDALRDFTRPAGLRQNPLLQSRLVVEQGGAPAGDGERIATLQGLIKRAGQQLESSPQEARLYRVIYNTYLHPAPTQEQAAELLDLPFSTYRRHLKAGLGRLTDILWQWELQGVAPLPPP